VTLDTHKKFNYWNMVTEPIRPSTHDLHTFRSMIRAEDVRSILILGVTPELIDLAITESIEHIAVVDIRGHAFEDLKIHASKDWESVEFIHSDWRANVPHFAAAFNLILGHGSFVHLEYPDWWIKTLDLLNLYLINNGKIVLRTFFRPNRAIDFRIFFQDNVDTIIELSNDYSLSNAYSFAKLTTLLKLHALINSIRINGTIDQAALEANITWLFDQVERAIGSSDLWKVFASEFEGATPNEYAPQIGQSYLRRRELSDFAHSGR